MPTFDGENPDGWVFRVERYFTMNGLSENEKLEVAIVSLDGEALAWFQGEDGRQMIRNWAELKEGSLCEKLLSLRQESSVRKYRRQFEVLAAPLRDVSEQVLESSFVNRLKPEVRAEIRLMKPIWLGRIMEVAQRVEERNLMVCGPKPKAHRSGFNETKGGQTTTNSGSGLRFYEAPTEKGKILDKRKAINQDTGAAPFRRMIDAELQAKREKGLCYRCDGKYYVGHRCPNRELQVLIVREEEEQGEVEVEKIEAAEEEEMVELSLNSVVGLISTELGSLKVAATFDVPKFTCIEMGRWHHSSAIT
ncbi:hypothetical protein L484_026170 [Morus notabilis]|uniref:Retrotransposon gag domain-containing protein n=1 Tax=Morus notabilis TaxID=981085 RepID=W9R6D8_9ROSA|nr:hypothetical protein L484_026170 [Morus notabilis]